MAQSDETGSGTTHSIASQLRLWPGVVIVAIQWLLRFALPALAPGPITIALGVVATLLGGILVLVWWGFFSRAQRSERLGASLFMLAALAVTPLILHESVATGMQGLMFAVYATPLLSLALVGWAATTRNYSAGSRRAILAGSFLLACGVWAFVRTGGFTGDLDHDFAWRWSETPEQRLLAAEFDSSPGEATTLGTDAHEEGSAAEWPGFRGPARDGVVHGVRIDTDWDASPPIELWRRPIGPGWSSFAVHGSRVYTQEQRGEDEVVSCYDLATGATVWMHRDRTRFWESNAGAGPRGTPMVDAGSVYALGATGTLTALDATDGSVTWTRDAEEDTGAELPEWGYSGSPLVVDDLVVVPVAGALIAYDKEAGEKRWSASMDGGGYSSPQLFTLAGVEQILFASAAGVTSLDASAGTQLWAYAWSGEPIVQPAVTVDGDLLISVSALSGLRRLGVNEDAGAWTFAERWTSIRLKPYYNDFVVHAGHAYGFDGGLIACIDLEEGQRQWKGGRYGHGQLILLADQDLLLILGEYGELALVEAKPEGFSELARLQAIESKTWNHPVLVGDVLLVRNAEEMAAFRLTRLSP